VARSPHSIIVFEHIERSHRDVAVLLMQIFRDGYVVDGHGTTLYFSNATIIMTTSAESLVPKLENDGALGFGLSDRDRDEHNLREAKVAIEAFFPPDFMDGIDEVLLFDPLSERALREIVALRLDDIRARLALRTIELHVTDGAVALLVEKGASREYGARNLGRTVEGTLLKPLAKFLLANPAARAIVARAVEGDIEICDGTESGFSRNNGRQTEK
jgi:ATP-dependent Clp protease ATP-binding subunit ClpC